MTEIIDRVSRETAATIDRVHGEDAASPPASHQPPAARTIHAQTRGVVTSVSTDRLRRIAVGADVCLVVVPRVGDFVATGMPLVTVHGDPSALEADHEPEIRGAVPLAKERDLVDDPAFGFRQLIDIAERALSPGVNDPTTAVHASTTSTTSSAASPAGPSHQRASRWWTAWSASSRHSSPGTAT